MATSNITNTIEDPSGNPVENVRVVARLMPCGAFRTADSVEVAREVETISDSNGDWSLALERNAGLTPSNTVYRITEHIPAASGGPQVWTIQVGDSNQTVLAALVDPPPAAQASSFLTQASADARYQALDSFSGTPSTIEPDDSADAGVSTSASRADHTHAIAAATPGTIQPDDSAAEGVATSFARSDHRHAIVAAAPSNTGDANSEGVSTSFARADHVHKGVVANDAWTDWTPSVTQSGSVTVTVTRAKYLQLGKFFIAFADLAVTGSGTTNNAITVSSPVTAAANPGTMGSFRYFDSGTGNYAGTVQGSSTTAVQFYVGGTQSGAMGISPNFAMASGDVFRLQFQGEAA